MRLFSKANASDNSLMIPLIGVCVVICGMFLVACMALWKGVKFIAREIVYFADGYPGE
jgi:hypothetical protein